MKLNLSRELYTFISIGKKTEIESLANKTVILDEAGAYKNLKTKVEDLFRF